ncbi:hypothetical protein [Dactylosporangium sp. NPDC005555]|uniref:hypothetical protein n=1 Tax=Dactylosporangium sp. NPDC005555 TaxID=3154889 RepID=UPI0033B6F3E0
MRPIGFALLLAAAALTGCSGGTAADPAPSPPAATQAATQTAAAASATAVAATPGCEFYQAADARAVLGGELKGPAKFTDNEPGKTDTRFNSCVYWSADDQRYANVGYRKALTAAGATDNRKQFTSQRTGDAAAVAGVGGDAYWDTPNGQVLVLVGDDLLVISTGVKDAPKEGRSRTDTEKLAKLVVSHLPA